MRMFEVEVEVPAALMKRVKQWVHAGDHRVVWSVESDWIEERERLLLGVPEDDKLPPIHAWKRKLAEAIQEGEPDEGVGPS